MRTVEKRCDTRMVMRAAAIARPARGGGVALEQRVLGLGVERRGRLVEDEQQRLVAHEAARQRELLPLAERHLDAVRARSARAACRGPAAAARRRRRRPRGRPPSTTAGSSSSRGTSPTPTVCRARNSKRKKSWNAPASRVAPVVRAACAPAACRRRGSRPAVGSYSFASSLTSVVLPAPFSPTMATTAPAGSVERHVVEHQARRCPDTRTTRGRSGCPRAARPAPAGRPWPRATPRSPRARPAAASRPSRCRAGSRSRRPSRRCTPTAARPAASTSSTSPAGAREPERHEDDRADVGARRTPPTPACASAAEPQRAAAIGRVPALPGCAPLARSGARRCR